MGLKESVAATIERYGLVPRGARVVVAVSGGPDSLALLDALDALAPERGWRLHVATFDHAWHAGSAEVAAAVAAEAKRRGLPCTVGRAGRAERSEAGAREQRQRFLDEVAAAVDAAAIALAHTADDRAETLLLNLLRGTGVHGLGALPPRAGRRVRPLIEQRREVVRAYAEQAGLAAWLDPANADPRYLRSRVRHELLPLLESLRPGAVEALVRSARICEAERETLAAVAAARLTELRVEPGPEQYLAGVGAVLMRVDGWADLPEGERWLVLREALAAAGGDRSAATFEQVRRWDALAGGRADAELLPLPWPGGEAGTLARVGTSLLWSPPVSFGPWGPVPVAPAGRTPLAEARLELVAGAAVEGLPFAERLPAAGALTVRSRRPGDRLRPRGRGGSRSVARLLSEARVPRGVRDRVPVVCLNDRPCWVPGIAVDEAVGRSDESVWLGLRFRDAV